MIGVSLSHGQDPWTSKQKTVHLSLHKVLLHLHVGPQQQGEGGVHIEQRSKQHVKSAQQTIISPRHPILGGRTIAALQQQQPETSVSMLQHPIASEIRWTTRAVDKADPRPSAPKRRGEQRSYSCSWGGVAGIKRGPTPGLDARIGGEILLESFLFGSEKVRKSAVPLHLFHGQVRSGVKWDTNGIHRDTLQVTYLEPYPDTCTSQIGALHMMMASIHSPDPPRYVSRMYPAVSRMYPACIQYVSSMYLDQL